MDGLHEVRVPLWRRILNPLRRYFRTLREIWRREAFIEGELSRLSVEYKSDEFLKILAKYKSI